MRPCRLILFIGLNCASLFADGGELQLRRSFSEVTIAVFSTPVPLRAGPADFSVLVEDLPTDSPVLDAQVKLIFSMVGRPTVAYDATRERSTNKLFYVAQVDLSSPGDWALICEATVHGRITRASTAVRVLPKEAPVRTYWFYFAILPTVIVLYILNRSIKQANQRAS